MKIFESIPKTFKYINQYLFSKYKFNKKTINLCYFDGENFGDVLSPIILDYMLNLKGLNKNSKTRKNYTFMSGLGSVITDKRFIKKTVWGSGSFGKNPYPGLTRHFARLDIRSLRGPLSEKLLIESKILKKPVNCYGDPGVLMPLIYKKSDVTKKYKVSVIPHYKDKIDSNFHVINLLTKDWKHVIDEIVESELVISSSLHGIIIAEAYGVPAIWLHNEHSNQKTFKYFDYYASTGRDDPICVSSIEEGLNAKTPEVPNLDKIIKQLLDSFPYDLWNK